MGYTEATLVIMTPLSKRLRKVVLILLVIVFIIGTPLLIGYSKGYRLDDALGLIQTGGIYLHSDVSNASVYIDDEFVKSNGTFLKNTLIQNLLPNRYYTVRMEHPRHQSWVKVLRVRPNLVTEARVMMLPNVFVWRHIQATSTLEIEQETEDVEVVSTTTEERLTQEVPNPEYVELTEFFSEDRPQFSVEVATSTYEFIRGERFATTTTVLVTQFPEWLAERASTSNLYEKEMVRERQGVVAWLEGGDLFAIWGREDDSPPYFFCEENCVEQLAINWVEPILRYDFFPNRNDVVILLSERGLYAVELDNRSERNIQTILEEPNLADFRLFSDGTLVVLGEGEYIETTL